MITALGILGGLIVGMIAGWFLCALMTVGKQADERVQRGALLPCGHPASSLRLGASTWYCLECNRDTELVEFRHGTPDAGQGDECEPPHPCEYVPDADRLEVIP